MKAPAPLISATEQRGFTVIEAMVALAILGIAAVGIIRASEAHIDTLNGLEQRSAAQWVAENTLAEAELGLPRPSGGGEVAMLGQRWIASVVTAPSADRDLSLATVQVRPAAQSSMAPMVTLRGFVDRGTVTP